MAFSRKGVKSKGDFPYRRAPITFLALVRKRVADEMLNREIVRALLVFLGRREGRRFGSELGK